MNKFIHEEGRIWLPDEKGDMVAEVLFPTVAANTVEITHTFVDDSLRGQGVAGKIMQEAADEIRGKGLKVQLTCTYAVAWFDRHKEYKNMVV